MEHNFLPTYLNDHMAGATAAVDMLERLSTDTTDPETRSFCRMMLKEVDDDRGVLRELMRRLEIDANDTRPLLARLGERLSRLKLRLHDDNQAGTLLEAFETLELGIRGKLALWAFQHIGILSLEFHVDKLSRPLL